MLKRKLISLMLMALLLVASVPVLAQDAEVQSGYVAVNDLNMYYEIRGTGSPLIVLHGAYMTIESMGEIIPLLAETRQVIAVELQAHGRTNDVEGRPLSYEQMADDVDGLMAALDIETADVLGYSMGASTALQLTIRHPERVRKLVFISSTYRTDGWYPELLEMIPNLTPEIFAGSPMEAEYQRLAPNPANFGTLVEKLVQLDLEDQAWSDESLQAITAPVLTIVGDSDQVRPEHAVEMFRLFGGGVPGDIVGLPNAQLAVIPAATHTMILARTNMLVPMITEFLDAPMPE